MGMNAVYRRASDCPGIIPIFPLPGALLLPRGQVPLNIFEPRYVDMVDEALRSGRVIGMIQPDEDTANPSLVPKLYSVGCAGRLTQFAETGDGRYLITLVGIARFRVVEEITDVSSFRQARVSFEPYERDFIARDGEADVDRKGILRTLRSFVDAAEIGVDWKGIDEAPNEALVNALCMMSPFGPREKQALLEARTLKERAETLIAITEIELARIASSSDTTMQ